MYQNNTMKTWEKDIDSPISRPVCRGPVSLPPHGGPRELLQVYQMLTETNRWILLTSAADCGDDGIFRLRRWEFVMGELVAVSLTGFEEGCHDRVDNSGLCQKGLEAKNRCLTSEVMAQYYLIRRSGKISRTNSRACWPSIREYRQYTGEEETILNGACGPMIHLQQNPEQLDLWAKGLIQPRVLQTTNLRVSILWWTWGTRAEVWGIGIAGLYLLCWALGEWLVPRGVAT